mgnify:CR=1 FL=1
MANITKINVGGVSYNIGGSEAADYSIIPITSVETETLKTIGTEKVLPNLKDNKPTLLYINNVDEEVCKNGVYSYIDSYPKQLNGYELLDYAQGDGTSYVNLEYESPYIGDEITVDMMWTDVQTTQNMGSNLAGYFGVSEGYFTLMGTKKIQAPAEPNKRVKVKLVYAQNGQSSTSGGSTSGPTTITGGSTSLLVSLYIDDQYVTSAEGTYRGSVSPSYTRFGVLGTYNMAASTAIVYSVQANGITYYPCKNEQGVVTFISDDYGLEDPSGDTLVAGTSSTTTHEFKLGEPDTKVTINSGYTASNDYYYRVLFNEKDDTIDTAEITVERTNYRAGLDVNVAYNSPFNPTSNGQPATKKYVDDKYNSAKSYTNTKTADKLAYIDNGYYQKPTGWTVVSEEPEWPNSSVIYFVCPDYVLDTMFTNVIRDGLNAGTTYSHITTNFVKPDTGDIVETWQSTVPEGATTNATTQTEIKLFKYDVNVGATPMFTDTTGDDLYLSGYIEFRDPETTALRWQIYLDEDNITSGTLYWFDEDDMGELSPTDYAINLGGGYMSVGIYYTVGTNSGLACLAKGTKITVPGNKTKAIDKLKVGDKVIDAEGNETTITKIYNHKVPMVFDITLPNGEIITASSHHKFKIGKFFRKACQVAVGSELVRQDSSTYKVSDCSIREEEMEVYEILTESNTYTLANGLICECEAI